MHTRPINKALWILLALMFSVMVKAQYTVSGGNGTPLLANDDTRDRLQVYLVSGMSGVTIKYEGTTAKHQWYRYKTKALEPEAIPSVQNGTTSTVSNLTEGYGYFVQEEGVLSRYVWIIDYSLYPFALSNLRVSSSSDGCSTILLASDSELPHMYFYTPSGVQTELKRTMTVSYNTLEWNEDAKSFSDKKSEVTLSGNPFTQSVPAPLCDTEICLSPDTYAEHFGIGQSVCTDTYASMAVELHADTSMVSETAENMYTGDDGLSAPVTVHFRAVANDPVASLYIWKIFQADTTQKDQDITATEPLVRYTGPEIDYTFANAGEFVAQVEVSDRSGTCTTSEQFSLSISESYLKVPNVFSPGTTPGINDEFRVAYKSLTSFHCWIFNRWGKQLYEWTNPAEGWDGKQGGGYIDPGVYFYVIEAKGSDGKKYKKSGDINVLRSKSGIASGTSTTPTN
jgi:gliding motility-associated-like protein